MDHERANPRAASPHPIRPATPRHALGLFYCGDICFVNTQRANGARKKEPDRNTAQGIYLEQVELLHWKGAADTGA